MDHRLAAVLTVVGILLALGALYLFIRFVLPVLIFGAIVYGVFYFCGHAWADGATSASVSAPQAVQQAAQAKQTPAETRRMSARMSAFDRYCLTAAGEQDIRCENRN